MTTETTVKIEGVESLPRNIVTKKFGAPALKFLDKKMKAISPNIDRTVYEWGITASEMYDRQLEKADELMHISPRFASIMGNTSRVQQNLGIALSTKYVQKASGLSNPMDNSLFMECVDAVIDVLLHGLKTFDRTNYIPRVMFKQSASPGIVGLDGSCLTGPDAGTWTQKVMLPAALASSEGLFEWENEVYPHIHGVRVQPNSLVWNESSKKWEGKSRFSLVFPSKDSNYVVGSSTADRDGEIGMRPRLVTAVSRMLNPPLMVANAIYMDSLTDQMKSIWKFDYPRLEEKFKGAPVHCVDFAQFEATQPRDLRHYVAKRLYSDRLFALTQHIDRMPMLGGYTNFSTGDRDYDSYYWYIDRQIAALADEFSPLSSGTGDTALMGKTLGTANQLFILATATGKSPKVLMPKDGGVDSIAAQSFANLGDDQAIGYRFLASDPSGMRKVMSKAADAIDNMKIFSNTLENPPKIAGGLCNLKDPSDLNSDVVSVTHDYVSLVMNRVFKEQDTTSLIRGDDVIGLHGALSVYASTIIPTFGDDFFNNLANITLDIIDCPMTMAELSEEAYLRETSNGLGLPEDVAQAYQYVIDKFGLTSISEIDYKLTREDIVALPDEVASLLWVKIDDSLVNNINDFVSEIIH